MTIPRTRPICGFRSQLDIVRAACAPFPPVAYPSGRATGVRSRAPDNRGERLGGEVPRGGIWVAYDREVDAVRKRVVLVVAIAAVALTSLPTAARALTAAELKTRIQTLQKSLGGIAGRLDRVEARLDETHAAIRQHRRLLARSAATRHRLQQVIGRRARLLYQMGAGAEFETLFTSEDLGVAIDRLTYLEAVQQNQRRVLEDIRTLRHEASESRAALTRALDGVRAARAELRDRRAELSSKLREYRQFYAWLTQGRVVLRASRRGPRGFVCPVAGGAPVSNNYGNPRPGGPHTGVDLPGETGDRLVAALPGRVVGMPGGGWIGIGVVIRDLGGDEWLYAHMSSRSVSVGDHVVPGEVVGRMGCTGNCWGSHLHFEWHPGGGSPRNPYSFLAAAC